VESFPFDGTFDPGEVLAFLTKKIKGYNPYEVIRTPSRDRGAETDVVTFRIAHYLNKWMSSLCGTNMKFVDKSEFVRHYLIVGLMLEFSLLPEDDALHAALAPVVTRIRLENRKVQEEAWDDAHRMIADDFKAGRVDGAKAKKELVEELRLLQRSAVTYGWIERIKLVSETLSKYDS
jgi:hypothetical protein